MKPQGNEIGPWDFPAGSMASRSAAIRLLEKRKRESNDLNVQVLPVGTSFFEAAGQATHETQQADAVPMPSPEAPHQPQKERSEAGGNSAADGESDAGKQTAWRTRAHRGIRRRRAGAREALAVVHRIAPQAAVPQAALAVVGVWSVNTWQVRYRSLIRGSVLLMKSSKRKAIPVLGRTCP